MNTQLNIADTIEPKSDQLNADDLIAGSLTLTVESVKRHSADQPVQINVIGHRPYRPSKSMRRVLVKAWGERADGWIGRSMTLFNEPTVKWAGSPVGGIRISHLSHIDSPVGLMLTVSRGKREPYKVEPLQMVPPDYPQAEFEKNLNAWVAAINDGKTTIPDLIQRVSAKGRLTTEQLERLEALTQGEDDANS